MYKITYFNCNDKGTSTQLKRDFASFFQILFLKLMPINVKTYGVLFASLLSSVRSAATPIVLEISPRHVPVYLGLLTSGVPINCVRGGTLLGGLYLYMMASV